MAELVSSSRTTQSLKLEPAAAATAEAALLLTAKDSDVDVVVVVIARPPVADDIVNDDRRLPAARVNPCTYVIITARV